MPDTPKITLHPVNSDNWRAVAKLQVTPAQRQFVAEPCYYLALCAYGSTWTPLAICLGDDVIGFMMWAVDPADKSCWLGGVLIDRGHQRCGYGRQSVQAAIQMLAQEYGHNRFALSYQPTNAVAARLYRTLGFRETGEWEDDEAVARLSLG